jgi:hypothetical protein
MISVIGDTTILDKGREEREKNMEIKKPYAVVQNSKYLKDLHIRSEVKLETFVNSALFRYTKGLALRNSIYLLTTRLSAVSEASGSGAHTAVSNCK